MMPIILLSGPVGAGKTTVASYLVANSPGPAACIEGDLFWKFIAKGGESQPLNKNFKMVMTSMTAAAIPYARADYEVVLDFSIPPWFLATARAIAKMREVPMDYVVLKPPEAVCAARAASRSEGIITDYKPYNEFYASFTGVDKYIVGDYESSPEKLAAVIRGGLNLGRFRL